MKKSLSVIASVCIVTGAYFLSFGVPDALTVSSNSNEASVKAPTAQPRARRGGGATAVVLTPLKRQPYEDIFRAVGSSKAVNSAIVSADVTGRVTEVNLAPNSQVSQGDILVKLDDRVAALNLETAKTELKQATDTVLRYQRLQQTGNSSVSDVTTSDALLAQRLAEVKLGLAQLALDERTVRAPITGALGLSDLSVGDIINAGNAIVTIDNSDALIVEFELPERSIGLLAVGRDVLVGTPSFAGRVFNGEVISFDSRIDTVTRSVTVKARVENTDGVLWPGMTFTVRVPNQTEPLAMLPSTAITWSRNGSSIWYDNDGTATAVPATILFRRNDLVWLDVDIPIGTMVVTQGAQKLRDGAKIADVNSQSPRANGKPAAEAAK